jgi:hypothetical protein
MNDASEPSKTTIWGMHWASKPIDPRIAERLTNAPPPMTDEGLTNLPDRHVGADWFHITGRGWVATLRLDPPQPAGLLRELVGAPVIIDDQEYVIRGVETFAVPSSVRVNCVGFLIDGDPR